jgi:hypothetical protein
LQVKRFAILLPLHSGHDEWVIVFIIQVAL